MNAANPRLPNLGLLSCAPTSNCSRSHGRTLPRNIPTTSGSPQEPTAAKALQQLRTPSELVTTQVRKVAAQVSRTYAALSISPISRRSNWTAQQKGLNTYIQVPL